MMCTAEAALQQEATALEVELVTLNAQIAEMGHLLEDARHRAAESKAGSAFARESVEEVQGIEKSLKESAEEVQEIEEFLKALQSQRRLMAEPEQ